MMTQKKEPLSLFLMVFMSCMMSFGYFVYPVILTSPIDVNNSAPIALPETPSLGISAEVLATVNWTENRFFNPGLEDWTTGTLDDWDEQHSNLRSQWIATSPALDTQSAGMRIRVTQDPRR